MATCAILPSASLYVRCTSSAVAPACTWSPSAKPGGIMPAAIGRGRTGWRSQPLSASSAAVPRQASCSRRTRGRVPCRVSVGGRCPRMRRLPPQNSCPSVAWSSFVKRRPRYPCALKSCCLQQFPALAFDLGIFRYILRTWLDEFLRHPRHSGWARRWGSCPW